MREQWQQWLGNCFDINVRVPGGAEDSAKHCPSHGAHGLVGIVHAFTCIDELHELAHALDEREWGVKKSTQQEVHGVLGLAPPELRSR